MNSIKTFKDGNSQVISLNKADLKISDESDVYVTNDGKLYFLKRNHQ
ncbi:hypothetical protein HYI43_09240 [Staphylococcus taiwanensis]|nr:hypothetical protein HYI43_09240 [Staphylococcus taiwanensis]